MILPKWKINEILFESSSSGLSILDVVLITKQTLKHSKKDSVYLANKINKKLINYIHLRAERQKAIDIFYKIVLVIDGLSLMDYSKAVSDFFETSQMAYNAMANKNNNGILIWFPKKNDKGFITDAGEFNDECELILKTFEYLYTAKNSAKDKLSYVLSLETPLLILASELSAAFRLDKFSNELRVLFSDVSKRNN